MKKLFVVSILFLSFSFICVTAQPRFDIGVFGGTSYYVGDLNPRQVFYQPSFASGALLRLNLNDRYSIRSNIYYTPLKGSDVNQQFPQFNTQQTSFSSRVIDANVQVEFNFFPYMPTEITFSDKQKNKIIFSPYLTAGLGYSVVVGGNGADKSFANFPFGLGIKFNITDKISAGAEWGYRKTFYDKIDGLEYKADIEIPNTFVHNNDWYSVAGLFITYKFFNFADDCPAY